MRAKPGKTARAGMVSTVMKSGAKLGWRGGEMWVVPGELVLD